MNCVLSLGNGFITSQVLFDAAFWRLECFFQTSESCCVSRDGLCYIILEKFKVMPFSMICPLKLHIFRLPFRVGIALDFEQFDPMGGGGFL